MSLFSDYDTEKLAINTALLEKRRFNRDEPRNPHGEWESGDNPAAEEGSRTSQRPVMSRIRGRESGTYEGDEKRSPKLNRVADYHENMGRYGGGDVSRDAAREGGKQIRAAARALSEGRYRDAHGALSAAISTIGKESESSAQLLQSHLKGIEADMKTRPDLGHIRELERETGIGKSGSLVTKVGPHGYVHGWHFVGIPAPGMKVNLPRGHRGIVIGGNGDHARVRSDKGKIFHIPHDKGDGPGRLVKDKSKPDPKPVDRDESPERKENRRQANEAISRGGETLFHGTTREFKPGDVISASHANPEVTRLHEGRQYAFASTDPGEATFAGKASRSGHVYRVEPIGKYEFDPHQGSSTSRRTRGGFRVVEEVQPWTGKKIMSHKFSDASLTKVGPKGYIHGWVCVRPPCGGSVPDQVDAGDLGTTRKDGGVVFHRSSGYGIGNVERKDGGDWSAHHALDEGDPTGHGSRAEAIQAVADRHNSSSGSREAPPSAPARAPADEVPAESQGVPEAYRQHLESKLSQLQDEIHKENKQESRVNLALQAGTIAAAVGLSMVTGGLSLAVIAPVVMSQIPPTAQLGASAVHHVKKHGVSGSPKIALDRAKSMLSRVKTRFARKDDSDEVDQVVSMLASAYQKGGLKPKTARHLAAEVTARAAEQLAAGWATGDGDMGKGKGKGKNQVPESSPSGLVKTRWYRPAYPGPVQSVLLETYHDQKAAIDNQFISGIESSISKVGPHGYVHGWIKAGPGDASASSAAKYHGKEMYGELSNGNGVMAGTYNHNRRTITDSAGKLQTGPAFSPTGTPRYQP